MNNALCSNTDGPGDFHTKWTDVSVHFPADIMAINIYLSDHLSLTDIQRGIRNNLLSLPLCVCVCEREKRVYILEYLYFKINFFDQWKYLMDYIDGSTDGVNYIFILNSDIEWFKSMVIKFKSYNMTAT